VLSGIDWKSLAHELVILSNLMYPNIPKFLGIVAENNDIELVFEYIDGKTLDDLSNDYFKEEDKLRIAKEICDAIYCVYSNHFTEISNMKI